MKISRFLKNMLDFVHQSFILLKFVTGFLDITGFMLIFQLRNTLHISSRNNTITISIHTIVKHPI